MLLLKDKEIGVEKILSIAAGPLHAKTETGPFTGDARTAKETL
jgi:hypothetical protein